MLLTRLALPLACAFTLGCSTTGRFNLPPDSVLEVSGREATPGPNGEWETSPYNWGAVSGARFRLISKSGEVVRTGTLPMRFRLISLIWPPLGFIYWPMGFVDEDYDLTQAGDNPTVKDTPIQPQVDPTPAP